MIETSADGYPMIERPWGYAIFDCERIWIPAIWGGLAEVLSLVARSKSYAERLSNQPRLK